MSYKTYRIVQDSSRLSLRQIDEWTRNVICEIKLFLAVKSTANKGKNCTGYFVEPFQMVVD